MSFPDGLTRQTLLAWFSNHSRNPKMEIEARIKGVTHAGFEAVLGKMRENKGWSKPPKRAETWDLIHASQVRETRDVETRTTSFMKKQRGSIHDTQASAEHAVRFGVSSETPCDHDDSAVHMYRHKTRYTFVHKGMFAFELTRVQQGASTQLARDAPVVHEIELEFCGQRLEPPPNPQYLADSMLMKVQDIVNQLTRAAGGGAPPAKRARVDGPQEGQPTRLQPGTAVALEPAGHSAPPPFGGEMPAEVAAKVPWVFSHFDAGLAHVASLPCNIDIKNYPLFYFYGTVPKGALLTDSG